MLMNFDTDLDVQGVRALTRVTMPVEKMTIGPRMSESRMDLLQVEEAVGWDGLRDYVVREIEQRFGPFPRDPRKEKAIFSSFIARWGDRAMAIAHSAFDVHEGWWSNAPISVNRFCKGSDKYFAEIIAERLLTPVAGW